MDVFVKIGKQFPEWEKSLQYLLYAAGESQNAARLIGIMFISSLIGFVILFSIFLLTPLGSFLREVAYELYAPYGDTLRIILAFIFSLLIVFTAMGVYLAYLSFKAESRRNAIESILPDYLSLVSSNIRSGMPLDQAMWQAAKPEFGLLSQAVREAIKESFSGKPFEQSLEELSRKFNSLLFKRIIEIIKQSVRSGGEIAVVLEKTADEAREIFIVKNDIKSNLIVYVIFLVFASSIGGPFLFAVSEKMLTTLYSAFSLTQSVGTTSVSGFTVSKPPIGPKELHYFSILTIFISVFITSLMIGSAYSGNKKEGLKYFPFMVVLAYIVFFTALSIMDSFFQGIAIA